MTPTLETLEEQAEKLKNAVRALASFRRPPQERLDTALSYFLRTFRDPPDGDAAAPYAAVYAAIGNPPVGTTVHVRQEALSPDELEDLSCALIDLCDVIVRRCVEAQRTLAAAAPPQADAPGVPEGPLATLVPARGADR